MKKLKKLSLKKIKIANVTKVYSLKGGMSEACGTDVCIPTETTYTIAPACPTTTTNTTTHTVPYTEGCTAGCKNDSTPTTNSGDNTSPLHSIEIC
jgi:hypothetical protein